MKLKILAQKRDLMKDSFMKNNYLISKGIISVSLLNSNPIVREKGRRERGTPSWMQNEAENKIASVSFEILFLKRKS